MLTTKEIKYLKKISHNLTPIFQIGKDGVSKDMIIGIRQALEKRELIKIKVLSNCDINKQELLLDISAGTKATVVQVIGNTITLYKQSTENKQIDLRDAR